VGAKRNKKGAPNRTAPQAPATGHQRTAPADAPLRERGRCAASLVQEPFGSGLQFLEKQEQRRTRVSKLSHRRDYGTAVFVLS